MEQWVRARLEEARFNMLTQLEENIAQVADTAQGAFGLAALRIARVGWKDLLDGVPTVPQADPSACPVDEYQHMVSMNVSLRSQLKEANAIARNVYKIILGPPTSTTRTVDTIFKNLEDGVRQLQKDMFVLQHAEDDPAQFDCITFSIKDFLQLAEFKMSHAAKRIFEVETNAAGSDGSGIDWEFRMQELTRDLQAQLLRTTRTLESEKITHAEAIRLLRVEIDDIKKRHSEELSHVNAAHERFLKDLKSAFAADMRDLGESLLHRVQDIQITFVHKLGEFRDLDSESKAASIRALQQVLAVERSRVEDRVNYFADADKALERNADRYVGDVAVYDDITGDAHTPWDGESAETLIRILKGKRAEMELLQQSFNVQNRMRNMEWETNLRDIMRQYEEEIGRMREKMKHLEAEAEHAAKLVTIRMQETAEARAEAQRAQRQKQDEIARLRAANEKEVAGLNQDIAAADAKLQKANETIAAKERQIADANRKNDQLLDEIDGINANVQALQEAMESMRPMVDVVDAEVQTHGKRVPDHEDFRMKHAQHNLAALGRIARGRSSATSAGSETDTKDRMQDVIVGNRTALSRDGTPLITPAPPPATVHSRRDSLAFQYMMRDAMTKKHTLDSTASPAAGPAADDPNGTPPQDGSLVPTEYTLAKAARSIQTQLAVAQENAIGLDGADTLAEGGNNSNGPGGDLQDETQLPAQRERRKSKFSLWYEEQQKKKSEPSAMTSGASSGGGAVDGGLATSSATKTVTGRQAEIDGKARGSAMRGDHSPSPRRNPQPQQHKHHALQQPEERDWMVDTIDPNYLARLLAPDPQDAKVLEGDGFNGAISSTSPTVRTHEEAVGRLVNIHAFVRFVCRLAVFVEFSSVSHAAHSAQSPVLRRLQAILPQADGLINTSVVKPICAVELACIAQFAETSWLKRLESVQRNVLAVDGQTQAKEAFAQIRSVLQLVRNLDVPQSIAAVPLVAINAYLEREAGLSPSSTAAQAAPSPMRATPFRAPLDTNRWLAPRTPSECKPILTALMSVLTFLCATGRLGAQPVVGGDSGPERTPSAGGGDGGGGVMRALTPARQEFPSPTLSRPEASLQEAMMVVSNFQKLAQQQGHHLQLGGRGQRQSPASGVGASHASTPKSHGRGGAERQPLRPYESTPLPAMLVSGVVAPSSARSQRSRPT